ncbi:phosphodiesterase [Amycolatopsis anabasis]|uniref:phosphodiesterase n=1 Tax=Amycolatopsis anabasis TaxID=1840409 RepID=UPI00131D3451|nr:phosphodiesterase [Amycolatopsis anabasis]
MIVLAHVSDIHLDGGERSAERTSRVLDYLKNLPSPVDAVLVTGDIADHGLAAEYRQARALLSLPYPVFHCPGNHDKRPQYREFLLGEPAAEGPINQFGAAGGAVFALCDSSIPGQGDGFLDDETLAWLDGVLAENADLPAFVCFHHPPVELHQPLIDAIRQTGEDRLAGVIERHPNVAALLCGHAHTPAATTFAGRPLRVAPGVVSTLELPWEHLGNRAFADGGPLDYDQPPAIAFHVLDDTGRLTTHYRVVP